MLTAGQYTFSNVTANHTIAVTFKAVAVAPTKCTATIALTGLRSGVLKLRKSVTIKGVVKPAHAGSAKLTIQRKVGARWVAAKTVARAINATSGAYSYAYKPTKAGQLPCEDFGRRHGALHHSHDRVQDVQGQVNTGDSSLVWRRGGGAGWAAR